LFCPETWGCPWSLLWGLGILEDRASLAAALQEGQKAKETSGSRVQDKKLFVK
jgi:hypothetical protein